MLFRIKPAALVIFITLLGIQLLIFTLFDVHLIEEEDIMHPWNHLSRHVSDYMNHKLVARIIPEDFCASETFMIFMVFSAIPNRKARDAIRATSPREVLGKKLDVFFLLGETTNVSLQHEVFLESQTHGDIIQERFIDSYYNLSIKSVMMLKSVVTYCVKTTKYILKVDDDMYVNAKLLVRKLMTMNRFENLLMGSMIQGAKPIRNSTNKWYCPFFMYDKPFYPKYVSGTAYVMSVDVAIKLYHASQQTPIFHLEDVYITGICAKKARVRIINNPLFRYCEFLRQFDPCVVKNLLTVHDFTPHLMLAIYKALHDRRKRKKC